MRHAKIAITLDEDLLRDIDRLVERRQFPNRSKAIQQAVAEKIDRMSHGRLARECAKLDPSFEKALAEEGLQEDLREWPEY
ncbi:MAG: ribbon-helix-helix domain-containing protein [Deltaproteobacteria bacterium]|nr:ribbon-helix-helix domain-containing protein [Deltaproteobacteria bacterium]